MTSIVWRYAQEFQNSLKAMKQMKPKETEEILPLFHLKRFVHASKTVNTTHWHCDWRSNIRGDFGVQHINLQRIWYLGGGIESIEGIVCIAFSPLPHCEGMYNYM